MKTKPRQFFFKKKKKLEFQSLPRKDAKNFNLNGLIFRGAGSLDTDTLEALLRFYKKEKTILFNNNKIHVKEVVYKKIKKRKLPPQIDHSDDDDFLLEKDSDKPLMHPTTFTIKNTYLGNIKNDVVFEKASIFRLCLNKNFKPLIIYKRQYIFKKYKRLFIFDFKYNTDDSEITWAGAKYNFSVDLHSGIFNKSIPPIHNSFSRLIPECKKAENNAKARAKRALEAEKDRIATEKSRKMWKEFFKEMDELDPPVPRPKYIYHSYSEDLHANDHTWYSELSDLEDWPIGSRDIWGNVINEDVRLLKEQEALDRYNEKQRQLAEEKRLEMEELERISNEQSLLGVKLLENEFKNLPKYEYNIRNGLFIHKKINKILNNLPEDDTCGLYVTSNLSHLVKDTFLWNEALSKIGHRTQELCNEEPWDYYNSRLVHSEIYVNVWDYYLNPFVPEKKIPRRSPEFIWPKLINETLDFYGQELKDLVLNTFRFERWMPENRRIYIKEEIGYVSIESTKIDLKYKDHHRVFVRSSAPNKEKKIEIKKLINKDTYKTIYELYKEVDNDTVIKWLIV